MKKLQLYAALLLLSIGINTINPGTLNAQQLPSPVTYTEKGEARGFIRVKLKESAAALVQLSPMGVNSTAKIGISAFDATSTHYQGHDMTRVFPYDAKNEHKLIKHGLHLWYQIEIDPSVDPQLVANAYSQIAEVELSEPILEKKIIGGKKSAKVLTVDQLKTLSTQSVTSDDPLLENQWHYANEGQNNFVENASINLLQAWSTTQGDRNVIISVHDEGIDINHEDLRDNIWVNTAELEGEEGVDSDGNGYVDDVYGYNFANNSATVDAMEHGTHVSGTVAAVSNNGIGVAGVAGGSGNQDGTLIMPCQILGGPYNNTAASFVYAANNGAVISQNSWGWTSPGVFEQATLDAIDYFIAEAGDFEGSPMKGGVVIVAAGNSNSDADFYPAVYENCLAVASTNAQREKAWYSNYGNWIDITAPGGDINQVLEFGVLSTLPDNSYGYLQGTSMACPHISGVAALVLSAMGGENYTPDLLWNQLLSSTQNLDDTNPYYEGKMGTGLIDAGLAVIENEGLAPLAITDLMAKGITDKFIQLEWTVPVDEDDNQPSKYFIYNNEGETVDFDEEPITFFSSEEAGNKVLFSVEELADSTQYSFAIIAVDRWGNTSESSNSLTTSTNGGPMMDYPMAPNPWSPSVDLYADVTVNPIIQTNFEIGNSNDALLTWEFTSIRQTYEYIKTWSTSLPNVGSTFSSESNIGTQSRIQPQVFTAETPEDLEPFENEYLTYSNSDRASMVIGEVDLSLPNATASAFIVSNEKGFNLTKATVWLNELTVGNAVVEIYEGPNLSSARKILEREITDTSIGSKTVSFEDGETMFFPYETILWLVYKTPAGNLYPVGISDVNNDPNSYYQWMSFDDGENWQLLSEALGTSSMAFVVSLESDKQYAGEHITLSPMKGEINGSDSTEIQLTADVSHLKNGYVESNIILESNDPLQEEVRIPVKVNISGHEPNVIAPSIVDFGSIQIGREKEVVIKLDNYGYGVFKGGLTWEYNEESDFTVSNKPYSVYPRASEDFIVTYRPTIAGNQNDKITITDREGYSVEIHLFGNGEEPAEIAITPLEQTFTAVLGETTQGSVVIENTGNYPLSYSLPKYTDAIVEGAHRFGYSWEKYTDAGAWQEIDDTEDVIDYTDTFRSNPFLDFVKVDLGFNFPFYDTLVSEMYLSHVGMLAIDDKDPVNGSFGQLLGRDFTSNGYIAFLYEYMDFAPTSKILFKRFDDRVIAEFKDMLPKQAHFRSQDLMTFQVVLFYDGNIEMRYKDMGWGNSKATDPFVGLESPDKQDGFYIYEFVAKPELLFDPVYRDIVIRVNHPGADIISNLSHTEGVIPQGASVEITYDVNTENLVEGMNIQNIAVVNNDPLQPIAHFTVKVDVIDGGVSDLTTSDKDINLGEVFKTAEKKHNIAFVNNGSAIVNIVSTSIGGGVDSKFSVDKEVFDILPRLGTYVKVNVDTEETGTFSEVITFTDGDGETYTFNLEATVIEAPGIVLDDQERKTFDLVVGETTTFTVDITNNGTADLEVLPSGTTWLYEQTTQAMSISGLQDFTYAWKDNKDKLDGVIDPNAPEFQWVDITKEGTKVEVEDQYLLWQEVDLPFELPFWNDTYNKMWIGYFGIITFTEPTETCPPFNIEIPNGEEAPHNFIAPLWSNVGEDYWDEDPRKGIWMWSDDEKLIVTYERYVHYYGFLGGYVSAQTIFYKNGTIKMQYKTIDQDAVNIFNKYFTLGMENEDGTQGVMNNFYRPYITDGLAVEYAPSQKTIIPVGETKAITFTVDAKDLLGGTYNHDLVFVNQTPGAENISIPVTVNVTGEYELSWSETEVDFGTIISDGSSKEFTYEFELQNIGTDVYTLKEDELSYSEGFGSPITGEGPAFWWELIETPPSPWPTTEMWVYPFQIFSKWWGTEDPQYEPVIIGPKSSLKAKVDFTISELGEVTKEVTVKNIDGSDVTIIFKANLIAPPDFEFNGDTAFNVNALTNTHQESKAFEISNVNGESSLDYLLNINFMRAVSEASYSTSTIVNTSALTHDVVTAISTYTIDDSEYHQVLRYDNKTVADQSIGYAGAALTTITAFDAPVEGFDLSHVATWFTSKGTINEGQIDVNIYTGTTANPISLYSESFSMNISELNEDGEIIILELAEKVHFLGNEKIFIEFVYPNGITYPQGIVSVDSRIENTFFIPDADGWYDLTNESSWSKTAFMVRALAKDEIEGSWLSLSHSEGTLEAGDALTIEALFDAMYAPDKTVYASIAITTNDPVHQGVNIPVEMILNQAPTFMDFENQYEVAEASELVLNFVAEDIEGHQITYEVEDLEDLGTSSIESGIEITLSPSYDMAGDYNFSISATDEHGLTTEEVITVTVTDTNRAPIGTAMDTIEITLGDVYYIDPETVFSDEDGDELSYSIANNNDGVVITGIANDQFVISTLKEGFNEVALFAADHETSTIVVVPVKVVSEEENPDDNVTSIDDLASSIKLSNFPNPAQNRTTISFTLPQKGAIQIIVHNNGQLVDQFALGQRPAGKQEMIYNVNHLSSGLYFYTLVIDGKTVTFGKLLKK
ncbi:S8 family serine peptidase [Flammeovirga sp. EKP202]|uniref:S8 family serine peptidase n=1 Tax=Flammeovirga sp. EKP202 TaxID=2770592 RepID=UPI00165FF8E6|nr:S8 family serine peptidase [Flammeovirga sp. EKP202]MBD0405319.1 S8 family serine peptidase [Flammeovirga sp. EKP202]